MFSYMLLVCFPSGYLRLVVHVLPYELITSYVDVLFFIPLFLYYSGKYTYPLSTSTFSVDNLETIGSWSDLAGGVLSRF